MLGKIAILLGSAALLPVANADLILHNGKVVTVNSRFTIQQAVAIRSWRDHRGGTGQRCD
jgi:hypothetical protein